jgi:hypothetical protein
MCPFCETVTAGTVRVLVIMPPAVLLLTPVFTGLKGPPGPAVLTSHCTVGMGAPVAAATKTAFSPAQTLALFG